MAEIGAPACCALVYHVNDLLVCKRIWVIVSLFCSGTPDYEIELGMNVIVYRNGKS